MTNSQYNLVHVLMGYRLRDSSFFFHCRCSNRKARHLRCAR